jgi:glutamine cyclotransferase
MNTRENASQTKASSSRRWWPAGASAVSLLALGAVWAASSRVPRTTAPAVVTTVSPQTVSALLANRDKRIGYRVLNSYPHDATAFTQGLLWHDGGFYESTGLEGRSTVRRVEFPSGRVLQQTSVPRPLFAEGLALVGERLVQLTWKSRRGLVYDRKTLKPIAHFSYETEGWGLAYDGKNLIMSDGSDTLTYLDKDDYQPVRRLRVMLDGQPVNKLNELEWIEGEVWANVWQTDLVVRIDPATGNVRSIVDLSGLLPVSERSGQEDVLNGIAYDPKKKRIFVTGKLWPRLFEIEINK